MRGAPRAFAGRLLWMAVLLFALSCRTAQTRWDVTSQRGETAALRQEFVTARRELAFAAQAAKYAPADDDDRRRALTYQAVLADLQGDHSRANRLYARAQRPDTPLLANVYAPLAARLVQMGMEYRSAGRYVDAARLYQRAFMVVTLPVIPRGHDGEQILAPFHTLPADPLDLPAVEVAYRASLAAQEARQGSQHPDLGWTLSALGDLAAAQARYADAERYYRRALAVREVGMGPGDVETVQSIDTLRTFYASVERAEDAQAMASRAREAWALRQPHTRTRTVGDWHIWARMAESGGEEKDAARYYARMLEAWRAAPPSVARHPAMRTLLYDYARFLRRQSRSDEATELAGLASGVPTSYLRAAP